jgi:hypothetical protein
MCGMTARLTNASVEVGGRGFVQTAGWHHRCVVDQHVDQAEGVAQPGDRRLHLLLVGDVGTQCKGASTRRRDLIDDPLARRFVDVEHTDGGTFLRKFERNAAPNAARCAGDQGDFVL